VTWTRLAPETEGLEGLSICRRYTAMSLCTQSGVWSLEYPTQPMLSSSHGGRANRTLRYYQDRYVCLCAVSLPMAEEERFSGELPDPPGGDGEPAVDVGVVRVRGVVWHEVGGGSGESITIRWGPRTLGIVV